MACMAFCLVMHVVPYPPYLSPKVFEIKDLGLDLGLLVIVNEKAPFARGFLFLSLLKV